MDFRKTFRTRGFLIWGTFLVFYIVIIYSIVKIQFFEKDVWEAVVSKAVIREKPVRPERGNIYDVKGRLLATTVSRYSIRIDCAAECLNVKKCEHKDKKKCDCKTAFDAQLDDFCAQYARLFPEVSKSTIKDKIKAARKRKDRAFMLRSKATVFEMDSINNIRRKGTRYRSVFVSAMTFEEIKQREYVYGILGKRTIGKSSGGVGIESGYDSILSGKEKKRIFQLLRDNNLIPADGSVNEDGFDLITTIDIELQDVVTSALQRGLAKCGGEWGSAVLMDVKTGQIRACANLTRGSDGRYWESLNNAVGYGYQPGSTFKTVTMLLTLNDFDIDLKDSVRVVDENWKLFGNRINDATNPQKTFYNMYDIMANSSNIGISKVVYGHYKDDPKKFLDGLRRMGIFDSITVDIPGSGVPVITLEKGGKEQKEAIKSYSYGYQIRVTPLHLATFYNAIANDGRMVKPRFVSKISYKGAVVKEMKTETVVKNIASKKALGQIRELLEYTGDSKRSLLKDNINRVAFKTGTTRLTDRSGTVLGYDASAAGYFPANEPRYTFVVLIHNPTNGYYGGTVAAPILKEVSDIISLMERTGKAVDVDTVYNKVPRVVYGLGRDVNRVYEDLGFDVNGDYKNGFVSVSNVVDNGVVVKRYDMSSGVIPNVIGMGIKDAVYILESLGLKVKVVGVGVVRGQSLLSGYKFKKGDTIELRLGL